MRTQAFPQGGGVVLLIFICVTALFSSAQIKVTTFHYDTARTGQNTAETTLTPANVNSTQFGKKFTVALDGHVYAQPLYLANVSIAGGTHNVLYVATAHDSVYAIDADSGAVLWQQSFINPGAGITTVSNNDVACGDIVPEIGIIGTPVIDPSSGTIYLVAKTKENGSFLQRLHAIDIVTHAEKFGGPVVISAEFGSRTFSPLMQNNRPALLLENGHVILGWGSHCDNAPYQGWLISYNASTLAQEAVFNTEPNTSDGYDGGIWMSGDGPAVDAAGNLYFASGNGDYDGKGNYGDSIMKLSGPSGGNFTVVDWFTPFNQSTLAGGDTDLGSSGLVLLPDLPSGFAHQQLLVQMGKQGTMYVVDRNNMGKYCSTCASSDTNVLQEIDGASTGVWGSPTFWNNTVYWGAGNDGGSPDNIKAWSFNANNSGLLSTSPVSETSQTFSFPTATPVISANGNSNAILWILDNSKFGSSCCQILYAFDASNLGTMLYSSNQAANKRDTLGNAVKFTSPLVVNGNVYVGGQSILTAFGLLSGTSAVATPTFSPAPGSYTTSVTVTVSDATSGASVHCTTDGSTPSASSPLCTSVTIKSTTWLQAIAVANGQNSAIASGTYSIVSGTGINFGGGFSNTGLTLNGKATINGSRLRLTDGGTTEAASAFYNALIGIQNFTTDFSFQLTNPSADGITFTIQGVSPTAIGPSGGGLGYGPDTPGGTPGIAKSVAIKFDLYSNAGEGTNSTGLYTNGASPTTPATDMTVSGVNLHSGDVFNVHITYDGTTLTMTVTDANTPSETFGASWAINIPATVGGTAAYVGFTGGTGGLTAIQDIITWTYTSTSSSSPAPPPPPASGSVGAIGIKFVGKGTAMGSSEVAGVVPQSNWNNASGTSSSGALALLNQSGAASGATVTWSANGTWALPITDTPGNNRMIRGYLDTVGATTSVTVTGLPANAAGYNVYVYADGDNGAVQRTATYQISGPGISSTSVSLTDNPNTNFNGVFQQANSSAGNYVLFTITATQFTITAIPGPSGDTNPRAPVNAIQIVPN